eukprot:m.411241 g.411241  ORF g.411241 m.411241 type:complete len:113 (-) comp16816_c0_seq6:121-459(-)
MGGGSAWGERGCARECPVDPINLRLVLPSAVGRMNFFQFEQVDEPFPALFAWPSQALPRPQHSGVPTEISVEATFVSSGFPWLLMHAIPSSERFWGTLALLNCILRDVRQNQ